MTDEEYRGKYSIGTKVRWVAKKHTLTNTAAKDVGKTGKIVGYNNYNHPFIFLPQSEHFATNSTQATPISWWAIWEDLEILPQKNKQLLFAFMSEAT